MLIILLVAGRRDLQKYSDWRQLWYNNFEDFARAEGAAGAENNTVNNVTVQLGATAYLHCHVRNPGDRMTGADVSSFFCFCCWGGGCSDAAERGKVPCVPIGDYLDVSRAIASGANSQCERLGRT